MNENMAAAPVRKFLAMKLASGAVVLGTKEISHGVNPEIDVAYYVRVSAGIGVSVQPVAWRLATKDERNDLKAQLEEDSREVRTL